MSIHFTLFIDAPSSYFCNWLEEFTWDVPYKSFPTEKGRISLQKARLTGRGSTHYMSMEGMYITTRASGEEWGHGTYDVIRFKVIPLTPNRIEISAEGSQPVVNEYFFGLLTEISKRWPQSADVVTNLAKLQQMIETEFADAKMRQIATYAKLEDLERKSLAQIKEAIQQGRIEQGEIQRALDAIRRAIRFIQTTNTEMGQQMRELADKAEKTIESNLGLSQKLELTLPILPGFLNYKIEFGPESDLNLEALWAEIQERWTSLVTQSQE